MIENIIIAVLTITAFLLIFLLTSGIGEAIAERIRKNNKIH